MYASKRRQRNFKRVRALPSASISAPHLAPSASGHHHFVPPPLPLHHHHHPRPPPPPHHPLPSNPSKRHRERLNGELDTVASLLPYEEPVLQRLDKLSILRLAVSFLQIKAHFQVCAQQAGSLPSSCPSSSSSSLAAPFVGHCADHPCGGALLRVPLGPVPSAVDPQSGMPALDYAEGTHFGKLAQKALGAFLLVLHFDGDIFFVSDNIDTFLGYQQCDVLHQPLFEMIHSEDREELRAVLQRAAEFVAAGSAGGSNMDGRAGYSASSFLSEWSVPIVLRFRCLLDNTCGFIRVELRTRLLSIHSHRVDLSPFVPPPASSTSGESVVASRRHALLAICTPFVPPLQMDPLLDDPILKSKHSLDLGFQCLDIRLRRILELDEVSSSSSSSSDPSDYPSSSSSADLSKQSLYSFVHPGDVKAVAEAHDLALQNCSSGLMVYRLVSARTQLVYFFQSSFRLFFKNGKPDSIGGNHRVLTEIDGESLLEKRNTLKFKYLSFDDTLLQSPRIFTQPAGGTHPSSTLQAPPPPSHLSPIPQKNFGAPSTEGATKSKKANKKGGAKNGGKMQGKQRAESPAAKMGHSSRMSMASDSHPNPSSSSCMALFAATQLQQSTFPSSSSLGTPLPPPPSLPSSSSSSLPHPPSSSLPLHHLPFDQTTAKLARPTAAAATRLKRTQVTFERYYAETVDLASAAPAPYSSLAMPPSSASASYYYSPAVISGFPPLMGDFAAAGYPLLHSPTADYWSQMMLAAVGGGADGMMATSGVAGGTLETQFPASLCFGSVIDPSAALHHQFSPSAWFIGAGGASTTNAPFNFASGATDFCLPPAAQKVSAASADFSGSSIAALYQQQPAMTEPTAEFALHSSDSNHCTDAGGSSVAGAVADDTPNHQWAPANDGASLQQEAEKEPRPLGARMPRSAAGHLPPPLVLHQHSSSALPQHSAGAAAGVFLQNTPGSAPSSASGFRFLSEMAQTLFG